MVKSIELKTVRASVFCTVVSTMLVALSNPGFADIDGFQMLDPQVWTYKQGDNGLPPAVDEESVGITNGSSQFRNIWYNEPQNITDFLVTFTYVPDFVVQSSEGFVTFIIQNDPDGTCALADNANGRGFEGITQSVGITLEVDQFTPIRIGIFRNGVNGNTIPLPFEAVHLNPIFVQLRYDGSFVTIHVSDSMNDPFEQTFLASPPFETSVGGDTAIVGFGAATQSGNVVAQTLSDFRYFELAKVLRGDLNGDGVVDLLDVQPFVAALNAGEYVPEADVNDDGAVNLSDVQPFVDLLTDG